MNILPKQNTIKTGVIIGILLPLTVLGILLGGFYLIDQSGILDNVMSMSPYFRERTLTLVAIASNAIPMNLYNKLRYTQTIRGIVFPTFLFIGIWLFYFSKIIFA